ncbi:uncharacterized protein N7482_010540 [Penicillium canariense]|uniref:Uncharacterized protein n=1 Tax=Penicillium canariense TaxID=189055 RepID=A0A9W9HM70_9EURO|nr:uncharacterized protein N7482_010540 [Penicillium canariense]KAJ5151288.1 hypothetical protein N7482_010540 [Penicillium canariense]
MAQLQSYIDKIPDLPLAEAIQAIIDLTPGLTVSVSSTGEYIIDHAIYEGQAHLNVLGSHYLQCGRRCQTEHAPFHLRLLHLTLDDVFDKLYGPPYQTLLEGLDTGSITLPESAEEGCACCRGDPDALILAGFSTGEALYFSEAEYKQIWNDQESSGSRSLWRDGEGWVDAWIMASKEQVEEAMARDLADGLSSKL